MEFWLFLAIMSVLGWLLFFRPPKDDGEPQLNADVLDEFSG